MPVEPKKFPAREVVVKVGRLGKKSQPSLGLRITQIPTEQPGVPARWINEPHQHLEGGSFPRAVRAEETEHFSTPDFETEAIHRGHSLPPEPHAENLGELLSLYYQIGASRHGSLPCPRKTVFRLYLGKTIGRLWTFEKRVQPLRMSRTGDRTGLGIQPIVPSERFLWQNRKGSRHHEICDCCRKGPVLCPIGFHRALQHVKIPFNDNFFHPVRQDFSHLRILRVCYTGFKKRECRVRIPCLRSHASGEPWEIGWAIRQAGRLHD